MLSGDLRANPGCIELEKVPIKHVFSTSWHTGSAALLEELSTARKTSDSKN